MTENQKIIDLNNLKLRVKLAHDAFFISGDEVDKMAWQQAMYILNKTEREYYKR